MRKPSCLLYLWFFIFVKSAFKAIFDKDLDTASKKVCKSMQKNDLKIKLH